MSEKKPPSKSRARVWIGPAGWSYRDWAGIVYPGTKPKGFDPLHYLARYFETIEIDTTFYGPMKPETAESWLRRVETFDRFRFTAKLWRRFTHERDSTWSAEDVKLAREAFEVFRKAGRLGAVLLQFPWSFRNDEKNQEWLQDVVAAFQDFPLVLEVRHASWTTQEFLDELRERGIGFVNIDQPLFRDSIAPSARATSRVGYIRVHGRNYKDWFREKAQPTERYNYLYSATELDPWAARARALTETDEVEDLYVVTNNHYLGKAPANALMLKSMLTGERVPSPPSLFAKYEALLKDYALPSEPPELSGGQQSFPLAPSSLR